MLVIPAGWLLAKDVVEILNLMRELHAGLCDDRVREILATMGEVFDMTASRNLAEAAERTGEARCTKLKVALAHLEGSYTISSWVAGSDDTAVKFRRRKNLGFGGSHSLHGGGFPTISAGDMQKRRARDFDAGLAAALDAVD